ncbi:hypothetical protein Mesil_3631 (plasmid) [Allomeiothermus silvanus DSM 9946]|uniref:TrbC/VIRB2 family protein n=1 Tax=Allomeiothermus silvanus (strain ATCC 700542 / DSM 9946 / NBRC 106475 / NCIMB 13440 / VI-R2) TaxID=526227 RepID=D7BJR5_ALLS1|nr:hypothetical protein [Allomeiothermus silvanus]ADH65421.1 hypothetical protein Mesil_3631 [Allomeiothermus silvanus DSM 9946]
MNQRGLTWLIVLVVMALGMAMAQTLEEDAANKTADLLCPIVNVLTGVVVRLIIIVLLAAAIITYFLVDARAAKTTAITLAIGVILVMNFATIQKIFTGYTLDTKTSPTKTSNGDYIRVSGTMIYCKNQ